VIGIDALGTHDISAVVGLKCFGSELDLSYYHRSINLLYSRRLAA